MSSSPSVLCADTHPVRISEEVSIETIAPHVGIDVVRRVFGKEKKKVRIYKGKGCPLDYGTGYEDALAFSK